VLTVGPHASVDPERAVKMHEILYPTDLTPESLVARPYALSLAEENQACLTLLNVCANPKAGDLIDPAQYVDPTLRLLRSLVPAEAELWCQPKCVVEKGDPAEKILEVAERRQADLIVLGVRGENGVPGAATHLGGALTHKIVARAKCPVLTVRG
jgi:nucleotide-binding universal stress UspA family protein